MIFLMIEVVFPWLGVCMPSANIGYDYQLKKKKELSCEDMLWPDCFYIAMLIKENDFTFLA